MKPQEQDRELASWLDAYEVEEIDPHSRDALLERIALEAASLQRPRSFALRLFRSEGWFADAAAMAAAALIGFWIGIAPVQSVSTRSETLQASDSSDTKYVERMVFGATSWKEVKL